MFVQARKFYMRRNKNKVGLLKPGAPLFLICFPEVTKKITVHHAFLPMMITFYCCHFTCNYDFRCSSNNRKIIKILRVLSTFRPFERFAGQLSSLPKSAGWKHIISQKYTDKDFCKLF